MAISEAVNAKLLDKKASNTKANNQRLLHQTQLA
jgi:hypothetical protein